MNHKSGTYHQLSQLAYDIQLILRQLESESGLSADRENSDSLLLFLWERRQELQQQVKEWQLYLQELDLPEGEEGSIGLQVTVGP